MKSMLKYHLPFIFIIGQAILLSCSQGNEGAVNVQTVPDDKLQTVQVVHPSKRIITSEIALTGTLKPNQEVLLFGMESGFIKSIHKDIGDHVKKGELIAELENPELSKQFEIHTAEFNLKKSVYDRLKGIYEATPDITTIEQLETAQTEYESSAAVLEATRLQLEFLRIKAPFNGFVSERFVDVGAVVQSGITSSNPQPIVNIMETEILRLNLDIPESDIPFIEAGTVVNILFPELPGLEFSAKVSRLAGALNPLTKTMEAEVDIDNQNRVLLPGMYARVRVNLANPDPVLTLPYSALLAIKNETHVFRVINASVVKSPIRIGISNKYFFEVLNTDITENDLVIIRGKELVSDGMRVEAIEKKETHHDAVE